MGMRLINHWWRWSHEKLQHAWTIWGQWGPFFYKLFFVEHGGIMPWMTAGDLHRCRNLSPGIWYTSSSINACRLLWIGYPPPWILILVGAKWSRSLIILSQYQYSMYSMYVWLIIKCIILKLCSNTLKSPQKKQVVALVYTHEALIDVERCQCKQLCEAK